MERKEIMTSDSFTELIVTPEFYAIMKLSTKGKSLQEFVEIDIKAIVVDIEGTTTPITFVTEVLFPYIKENIKTYLTKNWNEKELLDDYEALRALAESDRQSEIEDVPLIPSHDEKGAQESVVKNVLWQMSKDRKSTALKQLQGHMWQSAYANGLIKGDVYEDVPSTLKSLKTDGKSLFVYSSGSIKAQKLLFGHSNRGDLCPLFSGYFDTNVGAKKEASSYIKISDSIGENPENIIFLTDVLAEAEAATTAGMNACIVLRPGNHPILKDDLERFTTIKSFSELVFTEEDIPEKRQKVDESLKK
uniref:enolase-phosphatase E1-like isoform X1 n=2 Tax=Styela clava TaxID=7725 RepID=UPI00193A246D|nr:enolase-phosphatase E1-like isoform X1 [Styela clava]